MRLFSDAKYAFLGSRRRAYVVSIALILVGAVGLLLRGGFDAGVEFTGGTMVQVRFSQATDVAGVRAALNSAGFTGERIQPLTGPGADASNPEFLIRVPTLDGAGLEGVRDQMDAALASTYGEGGFEIRSADGIAPSVGSELRNKAAMALGLSFLLTLIYLAFRFEWRFGFAAIIATIHDMLITFGFIALLNIEISLATVAAILTIIGYSLNDTIVVFDRVRENFKKKRKETYQATLDRSINETLPRTVLTSGTTFAALLSLFILGGPVIRPFALVLMLGVLIGTYSSIFVASPALYEIEERARRRNAQQAARAAG
ncbi:MAG: protein translocase subunit SecF [Gemmatimonadota bacterium]|nr:protein translocase subunit SecF [Gemmatimonadota bacterium]